MTNNETKREIIRSSQFRKDVRLAHKQGKDLAMLEQIITTLANDEPLPDKYRDHTLVGNWKKHRQCHVTPDWLLVYKKTDDNGLVLLLVRVASHGDLDF